jgi:hypothetical protein
MCFKIRSMTARSLITAMNRIRPPQPVHVSASNPPDALQQRRPVPRRQRDLLHGRDTRRRRAHVEVAPDVIAARDHDAVVALHLTF